MFVLEHGIMNMQSPIALFNAKLAKTANHSATASADSLGGSAIERINDPHIMDKLLATLEPREEQIVRSEEHTSELQSLMRISYAVFCLKKKTTYNHMQQNTQAKSR